MLIHSRTGIASASWRDGSRPRAPAASARGLSAAARRANGPGRSAASVRALMESPRCWARRCGPTSAGLSHGSCDDPMLGRDRLDLGDEDLGAVTVVAEHVEAGA